MVWPFALAGQEAKPGLNSYSNDTVQYLLYDIKNNNRKTALDLDSLGRIQALPKIKNRGIDESEYEYYRKKMYAMFMRK
jgi:hypothetical protein